MNPITCLQKLKYVGTLSFATVDRHNDPQVRCVSGIHFEDDALYFFAARGSDFAKELLASGKVQIMGLTRFNEMIRVSGIAQQMHDEEAVEMLNLIFSEHSYLEAVYHDETLAIGIVFAIKDMVIDYFNWDSSPIFRDTYVVGNAQAPAKGYFITDSCNECGECLLACPQGVIEEGYPYEIEQHHCLRCGACFEVCPAKAIVTLS